MLINRYKAVLPLLFIFTLALMFLFLNYQQVFTEKYTYADEVLTIVLKENISNHDSYISDTPKHIVLLDEYFKGQKYLPHPMWHTGTYLISKLPFISLQLATVIFSTIIMSAWLVLLFFYLQFEFRHKNKSYLNRPTLFFFTFYSILFVGPMLFPITDYIIYFGKGSPNIWHNITMWMVKPFAFGSLVSVYIAIDKDEKKYYIIAFLLVILSIFPKPSFIIIFLPTLFLIALIHKIKTKQFYIFLTLLSIASISILLYQLIHTFTTSKVIFAPFAVWSLTSNDIPFSIILGLFFPILYSLLHLEALHSKLIQMAWMQTFIGILLYILFAQTGRQFTHANFSWSYMLAMSFLYIISITHFMLNYKKLVPYKQVALFIVLFMQVSIGSYYFYQIMHGQHPLFVSLMFLR